MPPYSAESLEGSPIEISAFEGEVVLINFWASWEIAVARGTAEAEQAARNDVLSGLVVIPA